MGRVDRLPLEEQLAQAQRDRRRAARERMVRGVAGDRWHRMMRVVPVLFQREGALEVRALRGTRDEVVTALREEGVVFAHDTALRLARGYGFLGGDDVFAYVADRAVFDRLSERGLIAREPYADTALVRPWPGPPRLVACVTPSLPPHRALEGGALVVTDERLRAELIGVVGLRADLFALAE